MASNHIKAVLNGAAATAQQIPIFANGGASNSPIEIYANDQIVLEDISVAASVASVIHLFHHATDGSNSDSWRTILHITVSATIGAVVSRKCVLPRGHKLFVIGGAGTHQIQAFGVLN